MNNETAGAFAAILTAIIGFFTAAFKRENKTRGMVADACETLKNHDERIKKVELQTNSGEVHWRNIDTNMGELRTDIKEIRSYIFDRGKT